MTDVDKERLEQNRSAVGMWIDKITREGKVDEMDPMLLRSVLESYGATFEISEEEKKSLGLYPNSGKRPGLDVVWGKDVVSAFKKWITAEFIPQYEQKVGRELYTLWDPKTKTYDNNKHAGMMQFLGELTAFAEGVLPLEEYRRLTENRAKKGRKFEYGDPYEPRRPSKNASFPLEFPKKAWEKIKSLKGN